MLLRKKTKKKEEPKASKKAVAKKAAPKKAVKKVAKITATKNAAPKKVTAKKAAPKAKKVVDSPLDFENEVSAADQFTDSFAEIRKIDESKKPQERRTFTPRQDYRRNDRRPTSRPDSRSPDSRRPASRSDNRNPANFRPPRAVNVRPILAHAPSPPKPTGDTRRLQVTRKETTAANEGRSAFGSSRIPKANKKLLSLPGQRVGVFVDVQNMYYSAKHLFNSKVNFKQVLEDAVNGRQLIRAIAYGIKADIKEEENFFEALEKIGFEVKTKDLQIFVDGSKKGDWDVGIAMDAMRLGPKLDVVVLVSGDGDFRDLVEYLKSSGCRVEALAFKKTASARLTSVVDHFTDLVGNKYLIK